MNCRVLLYAPYTWHAKYIIDEFHKKGSNQNVLITLSYISEGKTVIYEFSFIWKYIITVLRKMKLEYFSQCFWRIFAKYSSKIVKNRCTNNEFDIGHIWIGFEGLELRRYLSLKCVLSERSGTYPYHQSSIVKSELIRQGMVFMPSMDYLSKRRLASMDRDLYHANLIIVPSRHSKETFPDNLKEKVKVHPLGYNYSDLEICNGEKQIDILIVAGPSLRKGLHGFFKSYSDVLKLNRVVVVMGKGPLRKHLKNFLMKLKLNVEFRETMSRDRLMHLMSTSKTLVLPSIEDGFGMVALESLFVGTIPLVSKECGVSEVLLKYSDRFLLNHDNLNKSLNDIDGFSNKKITEYILKNETWKNYIELYDKYSCNWQ